MKFNFREALYEHRPQHVQMAEELLKKIVERIKEFGIASSEKNEDNIRFLFVLVKNDEKNEIRISTSVDNDEWQDFLHGIAYYGDGQTQRVFSYARTLLRQDKFNVNNIKLDDKSVEDAFVFSI